MPRPLKHATGTLVAVEIDGRTAARCAGVFAGDPDMVAAATISVNDADSFILFRRQVTAGHDTPLGVAAALASFNPGRAFIVGCPPEVDAFFELEANHV